MYTGNLKSLHCLLHFDKIVAMVTGDFVLNKTLQKCKIYVYNNDLVLLQLLQEMLC